MKFIHKHRDLILNIIYTVVILFINTVIYMIVFLNNDWFECGSSYLNDRSTDGANLAFMVLLVLAMLLLIRYLWLTNHNFLCYLALVFNCLNIAYALKIGLAFMHWGHYYEEFNSTKWNEKNKKPIKMICYMINYEILKGKSKKEIHGLLGQSVYDHCTSNIQNPERLCFLTNDFYTTFVVEFSNDTVSGCILECHD